MVKKTIDYINIEIVSHSYLSVFVFNSTEKLYTLSELRENSNQFTWWIAKWGYSRIGARFPICLRYDRVSTLSSKRLHDAAKNRRGLTLER